QPANSPPGTPAFDLRYCEVTVDCVERSARAAAERVCVVSIPTGTGFPTGTTSGGNPAVVFVEPDQPREIQGSPPTEPYASSKGSSGQAFDDQWALGAIHWLRPDGTTVLPDKGAPVIVAVIDTGVDIWHPDILGANWLNKESPKSAGGDYEGDTF